MNILFLTCWYPTKEIPSKGIFIKEHAKAISHSQNNIVVLALNVVHSSSFYKKQIEKFFDENGIETHIIHLKSRCWKWIYVNPFFMYGIIKKYYLKEISKKFRPDIIHSNILNPCAIIGNWLAEYLKKPHIITEHWSGVDNYMKANIFSKYGRQAYENAKVITTVSEFLKKNVEKYVSNAEKIKVIPNVVDAKVFFYKRKVKSDKLVFTAIANWKHPKAPMFFIEALNNIKNDKEIILNMVGAGDQLYEIKKIKLNYTINFKGNIPKTEIAETLHASDFFLHASYIETFSLVIAEALSTGTPVIASNVGAIPELVNEANGILCNNDIDAWKSGIEKAIKREFDFEKRNNKDFDKFSLSTVVSKFDDVYKFSTNL